MGGRSTKKIEYLLEVQVADAAVVEGNNGAVPSRITCDMEIRVHAHQGALPTVLLYGLRSNHLYTHKLTSDDLGSVEYAEIAVRRGAPSARGTIKSNMLPFVVRRVRVTERRPGHTCTSLFRRETPLVLGDALGLSVLLEPITRSVQSTLLRNQPAEPLPQRLAVVAEVSDESVSDTAICVSEAAV